MASTLRKIFRRKKPAPMVCSITLDDNGNPLADDPHHQHTGACFIEIESLAIVELFQSQGCVSCPPVIPSVHRATSENPNRLLLTYNVTIFDHLGWKDTFASSRWDQRHRAYAKQWHRNTLFTPQVVVNGFADTSGANGVDDVSDAVQRARTEMHFPWHIYMDANDTEVRIDSDAPDPSFSSEPFLVSVDAPDMTAQSAAAPQARLPVHDIMLLVYRDMDQTVKIGKGPNKGKKLIHRNLATDIIKLGEWQGGNKTLSLPSAKSMMQHGTGAVAFVQAGSGGPIVAATKI